MTKTPMMQQYDDAKQACGDALLFFRMGDFYELFHEDARIAARLLGLTLTSRDKSNEIPMAGFPHHQLDGYLGKLIQLGHRVAVCDQVEDPQTAKGLVRREVQQIVSPGTLTDLALLQPHSSNYLVAINRLPAGRGGSDEPSPLGVAWAEISTGRFLLTAVPERQLSDLLARLNASEILLPDRWDEATDFTEAMITRRPDWCFAADNARQRLIKQLQVHNLDGFGVDEFGPAAIGAAGAILEYLSQTQRASLDHFNQIKPYRQQEFVEIDAATWRSLEISQTLRGGQREGSLLGVIDRCQTPMGSRLLGDWLANPLTDLEAIEARQDALAELLQQAPRRTALREQLNRVYDLQRLLARVAAGRPSPRDLSYVGRTLELIQPLQATLQPSTSRWLQQRCAELDPCESLQTTMQQALVDPCPAQAREGGFIRAGFDESLDRLRELAAGGKQWIAQYQQTICQQTGIPSLKVGYNKVFGYYLEVTHTHRDKIPDTFIRKQTLKNAERYITPELKEYEEQVLSADTQAEAREQELLEQLRELARAHTSRLKVNAEQIAQLDTLAGLAQLASEQSYCRPQMVTESCTEILEGRHPVLDIVEPLGAFVPNDTRIDAEHGVVHLITGPNMAGKSTYIRQVALISLMAQIGSFVPAQSARLGLVDRIFARVGANDELARGQSTFMVEMTETARILNTATARSLVILDEIGRGTSTYDGVSLAWAIVEYLHDQIGCRTLFATHYHELTELQRDFEGVANYNVAVREWEEKIVFLHKIVPGSADQSYGIHVARLAGIPTQVNRRAQQILDRLESQGDQEQNRQALGAPVDAAGNIQLTLFGPTEHPLVDKLRALDANQLTPLGALQMLHQWQAELNAPADAVPPRPAPASRQSPSRSG